MFQSKNCGHGFDLYVKVPRYTRRMSMPLTREQELIEQLEDYVGEGYISYFPQYCPICGKKVEWKGGAEMRKGGNELYREETCKSKDSCDDYKYWHCVGCNGCKKGGKE